MMFESEAGESFAEIVLEEQQKIRTRGNVPWVFRPNAVISKWFGIEMGILSLEVYGLIE